MKPIRHAALALLTAAALSLSLAAPAAAYHSGSLVPQSRTYSVPFTDTQGTWCDDAVQICYETGLMDGKSATSFDPHSSLTYAQIIVIVARLHELLNGGDGKFDAPDPGDAWYQPAVDYLLNLPILAQAGDLSGLEVINPEGQLAITLWSMGEFDEFPSQPCTRYDLVFFLTAILPEDALTPINSITALPDVTGNSVVLDFYNAGILTGSNEYGTFGGTEYLNRGQAAAMLARIVDPSLRVRFTPKPLVLSQALLGKDPDEVMMTVDGFDVTAGLYALQLSYEISEQTISHYFSRYDNYPEEYSAYLTDEEFRGDFAEYMMEKYGIDVSVPIDWDAPDKGGMSPAQKVLADTREECIRTAVLMNHQTEYPPTQAQQADKESFSYLSDYMGITRDVYETMYISECVWINLQESLRDFTSGELNRYLTQQNFIYGMYAVFYRDDEYGLYTEKESREMASTLRSQINDHLDDQEYISYLIWKYSQTYSGQSPDLISLDQFSDENIAALKSLGIGKVSAVLTEEDRYIVVFRMDPSKNDDIVDQAAAIPAQEQLDAWCTAATVTAESTDPVDMAAAAGMLDTLGYLATL